jgi:hypothetical protein
VTDLPGRDLPRDISKCEATEAELNFFISKLPRRTCCQRGRVPDRGERGADGRYRYPSLTGLLHRRAARGERHRDPLSRGATVGKPETFVSRLFKRGRPPNAPATKVEIGTQQALEHVYHVRHLERPKGNLADVIRRVVRLLVEIRYESEETVCVLDTTGVGHPAFSYMVREIGELDLAKPLYISAREIVVSNALGGSGENGDRALVVARRDLITAGRLTMRTQTLRVAPKLRLADVLREELGTFTRKPQKTDVTDPWRLGSNDDLVLATVAALYVSERFIYTPSHVDLEDALQGTPFDSSGSEGEG